MIQAQHDTAYVCEIRFSRHKGGPNIIDEVKQKLTRLVLPKNISKRAVLLHVNRVSESVEGIRCFSNIIDFAALLTE